ncbi:unnamed protein product, partial [Ectocarpus sp. 12 AP-2014]
MLFAFSRVMLRRVTCHLARREEACMCVVARTVAVDVREPICRIIPRMMFLILVTTPRRPYYQPRVAQRQTSYAPLMALPLFLLPCYVHCFADRLSACPTNQTPWWAWARDAKNNRVRVCFRALFLRTSAPTTYSSPARFRSLILRLPVATASVTLPIGQTVTKDEYRLACENSMGD